MKEYGLNFNETTTQHWFYYFGRKF